MQSRRAAPPFIVRDDELGRDEARLLLDFRRARASRCLITSESSSSSVESRRRAKSLARHLSSLSLSFFPPSPFLSLLRKQRELLASTRRRLLPASYFSSSFLRKRYYIVTAMDDRAAHHADLIAIGACNDCGISFSNAPIIHALSRLLLSPRGSRRQPIIFTPRYHEYAHHSPRSFYSRGRPTKNSRSVLQARQTPTNTVHLARKITRRKHRAYLLLQAEKGAFMK